MRMNLKIYIMKRGISINHLGRKLNFANNSLNKYFQGRCNLTFKTTLKLLEALGISENITLKEIKELLKNEDIMDMTEVDKVLYSDSDSN